MPKSSFTNDSPKESASDGDYDLLPHKKITQLEEEFTELKRNPFGTSKTGKTLNDNVEKLCKCMDELLTVFKTASVNIEQEQQEAASMQNQLGPLMEKIDMLIDQNKKIAKGIVALADMMEEQRRTPALPPPPIPPRQAPSPFPPPLARPGMMPLSTVPLPERPPAFSSNPFEDIPPITAPISSTPSPAFPPFDAPPRNGPPFQSSPQQPPKRGLFGR